MGATVTSKLTAYKLPGKMISSGDLFGSSEAIIIFAERFEKNCYPHTPSPRIDFIGSMDMFVNQYIPWCKDAFDDGIAQATFANNGSQYVKYVKELVKSAPVADDSTASSNGFRAYSYELRAFEVFGSPVGFRDTEYLGQVRKVKDIYTVDDLCDLVDYANAIRQNAAEPKWWYGIPSRSID